MFSSLPRRRRAAYTAAVLMMTVGTASFFLRHYLYCGILAIFLFGIGFAWAFLLILQDRAPRNTSRLFLHLFHILFVIFLLSFIYIEIPVIREGVAAAKRTQPPSEDIHVILVPGAGLLPGSETPSLLFRLRLERAEALYKEDTSRTIVICGGQGNDEIVAEATAGRNYLLKRGLPGEAVIAECESLDTAENFQNFRVLFPDERHVALVTNDFHVHRCSRLAERYGLEVTAYSMPTPQFFLRLNYFMREYISFLIFAVESQGFIIDTSNFHI